MEGSKNVIELLFKIARVLIVCQVNLRRDQLAMGSNCIDLGLILVGDHGEDGGGLRSELVRSAVVLHHDR